MSTQSESQGSSISNGSSPCASSDTNTLGSLSPPELEDFAPDEEFPIQCPVFCEGQQCEGRHHILLQAILNCSDTSDAELMERRLNKLEESINNYKGSRFGLYHVIPDKVDRYKATLGHWACALGHVEAMRWLCEHGFNPLTKTKRQKETPLHFAIKALPETCPDMATEKLQDLLPYLGSTFLATNINGNTPLHVCCSMLLRCEEVLTHRYVEFMAILLSYTREKYPAVLEQMLVAQNYDGQTPLHMMSESDARLGVVKMLVQLGADMNIKNNKGQTPLDIASENNQSQIVHYLCSRIACKPAHIPGKGGTPSEATSEEEHSSQNPSTEEGSRLEEDLTLGEVEKVTTADITDIHQVKTDEELDASEMPGDTEQILQDEKKRKSDDKASEVKKSKSYYTIEDNGKGNYQIILPGVVTGLNIESTMFPTFVKKCESDVQEKIYNALVTERKESMSILHSIQSKQHGLDRKVEKVMEQQAHTTKCIQDLLERLEDLKREEVNLRTAVTHTDEEIKHKVALRLGLQERLHHCNAALNALAAVPSTDS